MRKNLMTMVPKAPDKRIAELETQVAQLQMQLINAQQSLIDSQQQVIALKDRIEAMTPITPDDEDAFWHIHADMSSSETARSTDLATVRRFQTWLIHFAEQHLRPYVNPKVYGETLNQMTRGLPEHIAELETQRRFGNLGQRLQNKQRKNPQQLRLIR